MRELLPVLSCRQAVEFEGKLLSSEGAVWSAMQAAGSALGRAVYRDFTWWKPWPAKPRILLLAGKGNNGGDAMIAAAELAGLLPELEVTLVPVYGQEAFKTLPQRAFGQLAERLGIHLRIAAPDESLFVAAAGRGFDLTLDGILGAQFRPPVRAPGDTVIDWSRRHRGNLGFRVAVDLPSGMGDDSGEACWQADVTYATGVVKRPVLVPGAAETTGRLRFLDLGFFARSPAKPPAEGLAPRTVLPGIGRLRAAASDKRQYGQVFLLGGSSRFPGAILMAAQSAVRSGAGLVTAMVPEPLAAHLAAGAPEVMWLPLPTRPAGDFAEDGLQVIQKAVNGRSVILVGPGLQVGGENARFVSRLLRECPLPMVLDAGALVPEVVTAAASRPESAGPLVLTPHLGEFKRISQCADGPVDPEVLKAFSARHRVTTLLKGPITRVSDGRQVAYVPAGNPVLARGGSGDILGGLLAVRLAMRPEEPLRAAVEAVVWHGEAADLLARERGETAVRTTELLDYLSPALRTPD